MIGVAASALVACGGATTGTGDGTGPVPARRRATATRPSPAASTDVPSLDDPPSLPKPGLVGETCANPTSVLVPSGGTIVASDGLRAAPSARLSRLVDRRHHRARRRHDPRGRERPVHAGSGRRRTGSRRAARTRRRTSTGSSIRPTRRPSAARTAKGSRTRRSPSAPRSTSRPTCRTTAARASSSSTAARTARTTAPSSSPASP